MIIEFLDGANRSTATKAQLETYDLLRSKLAEGRPVSTAELLKPLGLSDLRPLISRIKHLAEKGFLRFRPETEKESAAVA
ncbi:MAG: hypothetical protein WA939_13340 [Nodosilinea sp.]